LRAKSRRECNGGPARGVCPLILDGGRKKRTNSAAFKREEPKQGHGVGNHYCTQFRRKRGKQGLQKRIGEICGEKCREGGEYEVNMNAPKKGKGSSQKKYAKQQRNIIKNEYGGMSRSMKGEPEWIKKGETQRRKGFLELGINGG